MSAFKIPRGRVDEPSTAEMFDAALLRSIKIVHQGELVKGSLWPERLRNDASEPRGIHPSWLP